MPMEKDLKRIVRSRMQKTGESYTSARRQILNKKPALVAVPPPKPPRDYAALAGMSDATMASKTGHSWAEWVDILEAFGARDKPHRDVAAHVYSLGVPGWWSQCVTVGYERIRGLRERGQRRSGSWEASKSRTFSVPVETLFAAFADARKRKRWLGDAKLKVRKTTPQKSMRITWEDGSSVELWFQDKGAAKSVVAVQHTKLATKAAAAEKKAYWAERLDALAAMLKK